MLPGVGTTDERLAKAGYFRFTALNTICFSCAVPFCCTRANALRARAWVSMGYFATPWPPTGEFGGTA
ncbi:MAG: hypothetical protein J2P16_00025 [Mycobacterium sp.]|nr:hypothetical protein [Mycobacterium sp.]